MSDPAGPPHSCCSEVKLKAAATSFHINCFTRCTLTACVVALYVAPLRSTPSSLHSTTSSLRSPRAQDKYLYVTLHESKTLGAKCTTGLYTVVQAVKLFQFLS